MSAQLTLFDVLDQTNASEGAAPNAKPRRASGRKNVDLSEAIQDHAAAIQTAPSVVSGSLSPTANLPMNMQEVLDALLAKDTRESSNIQMRSAISTFRKVIHPRQLVDVPVTLGALGKILGSAKPQLCGVSKGRWSSVCSLIRRSLEAAGHEFMPGRANHPLSEPWETLSAQLPRREKGHGLSRLMRHFTRLGIEPHAVTAASFEGYRSAVGGAVLTRPEETYRKSVKAWNAAVDSVPGWPQVRVELDADPRHYSLAWSEFPQSFRDDVEAFLGLGADDNPFAEHRRRSSRPSTVRVRRNMFRQMATGLVRSGFPVLEVRSLAVLARHPNGREALKNLWELNSSSKVLRASQARLLAQVARHYVGSPDDAQKLADLAAQLRPDLVGMTVKNRERLRQFDSADNVSKLIDLPRRIVERAERRDDGSRSYALEIMNALAMEILLHVPLRASNLFELRLGKNVIDIGGGWSRRVHIVIPPGMAKTAKPYEVRLSASATRLLDLYLERYRGRISNVQSDILFPNVDGKGRHRDTFARSLCGMIAAETGLVMNVHLFRHFAGYIILKEDPQAIELVRQLLGHSSIQTTLKFYAEIKAEYAAEAYEQIIERRRATPVASGRRRHTGVVR